ncbi:MAG: carboxylating nicotinate-nucleotide diphosphorylase [Myxococcales bacterium]|nr:carboxylating nicotinate-nucleotide diphosphorylase [Myxococcales bacterium]
MTKNTLLQSFSPAVQALVDMALTEDLNCGDITSDLLIDESSRSQAVLLAKEPMSIAGLPLFVHVLHSLDPSLTVEVFHPDGSQVDRGTQIAIVEGGSRALLRGERTALNFVRHLSGVATLTRKYISLVGAEKPWIVDTRKTTPGFRELEKYAVRMGGGRNHRFNLGAAVMLKDNHIVAGGGITAAVQRVKSQLGHAAVIEVETTNLDEVKEALDAGAHVIMLDNMDDQTISEAVALCAGKAVTEASGGITHERLAALAETGVDVISIGALTHSAPAADLSLNFSA